MSKFSLTVELRVKQCFQHTVSSEQITSYFIIKDNYPGCESHNIIYLCDGST